MANPAHLSPSRSTQKNLVSLFDKSLPFDLVSIVKMPNFPHFLARPEKRRNYVVKVVKVWWTYRIAKMVPAGERLTSP